MSDTEIRRIERDQIGVLLVDAQPAFWEIMSDAPEPVMARIEQLLVTASITSLPLVATFEDPTDKNGWLPDRLEEVFPDHGRRFVKRTYDCCREPEVRDAIAGMDVTQIAVAGAETDVCVLQSVFGLLEMGLTVFVLEDCVFTHEASPGPALERMYGAGAIPCTFKMFFYEVNRTADHEGLPEEWRRRCAELADRFQSPYDLPPWRRER